MTARTSIAAYEDTLEYHPTTQWFILEYLASCREKHITYEMVCSNIPAVDSTSRTRLRELADMGFVRIKDEGVTNVGGREVLTCRITSKGRSVLAGGRMGRYALRNLGTLRTGLQKERARALAEAKDQWEQYIISYMSRAADIITEQVL